MAEDGEVDLWTRIGKASSVFLHLHPTGSEEQSAKRSNYDYIFPS